MLQSTKQRYNIFALHYVSNGLNGAKAAKDTGFAKSSAKQTACRLLTIDYVKEEVARLQALFAEKAGMTVERVQQMYLEDREFAKKCNQAGAVVSATTGIARLYGFDKDGGKPTVAVVNVINYAGAAGVKPPPKPVESIEL